MVFYFTSTGNCLYVAREFDTKARSIPQEKLGQKYQDESIGVVCPVYWNDVPPIVTEFLRKATFETDYFYMVMTYGYRHGGAALRAKELCINYHYILGCKHDQNMLSFSYGEMMVNGAENDRENTNDVAYFE